MAVIIKSCHFESIVAQSASPWNPGQTKYSQRKTLASHLCVAPQTELWCKRVLPAFTFFSLQLLQVILKKRNKTDPNSKMEFHISFRTFRSGWFWCESVANLGANSLLGATSVLNCFELCASFFVLRFSLGDQKWQSSVVWHFWPSLVLLNNTFKKIEIDERKRERKRKPLCFWCQGQYHLYTICNCQVASITFIKSAFTSTQISCALHRSSSNWGLHIRDIWRLASEFVLLILAKTAFVAALLYRALTWFRTNGRVKKALNNQSQCNLKLLMRQVGTMVTWTRAAERSAFLGFNFKACEADFTPSSKTSERSEGGQSRKITLSALHRSEFSGLKLQPYFSCTSLRPRAVLRTHGTKKNVMSCHV